MLKSFWELLIPAIAVVLSLIQVANRKKSYDKAKNKKKESTLLLQTDKGHPETRGRVIYEGYLSRMYPREENMVPARKESVAEIVVAEPATAIAMSAEIDANPNKEIFPEVGFGEGATNIKVEKGKPVAPLAEFTNPAAILQGIIFSEVLAQPKAKNKFRYR